MKTLADYSDPAKFSSQSFLEKDESKLNDPLQIFKAEEVDDLAATKKDVLIFLVDDDLLFLKVLEQSILTKFTSVSIKTFQTGEACLHQIKLNPDIIILDYSLNSEVPYAWNGITILKQIKKTNPKTKVIMLSSQDSLDVAEKSLNNGSYDYISKSESSFIRINNILTKIIEDKDVNKDGLKS